MSAPKSVVKIKKDGVEYTSNVDACQYYIFELTRAALRDVGKFIAKTFKKSYYEHFTRRSGNAGKATKYKVLSNENTTYPRVEIGLPGGQNVPGFYSYFQEFGSSKTQKLGLLTHAAKDNIAEIVKIESQYLSGLSGEAEALERLVNEEEMEGDADEQDE